MNIAIEEQQKCTSYPKVGAVVVKDGKILSKAYRNETGENHAERIAIERLSPSELVGSTLLTTLEPCVEIYPNQDKASCTDLIIEHRVAEVVIGILDPRGGIYCEGYEKLRKNKIKVRFFTTELREKVEAITFEKGDNGLGYGPRGTKWLGIIGNGTSFEIQFSETDNHSIRFEWQAVPPSYVKADLVCHNGSNDAVTHAKGMMSFDDITAPLIFREPSHVLRMEEGYIAVINDKKCTFIALVKLLEVTKNSVRFQWEVRDREYAI